MDFKNKDVLIEVFNYINKNKRKNKIIHDEDIIALIKERNSRISQEEIKNMIKIVHDTFGNDFDL